MLPATAGYQDGFTATERFAKVFTQGGTVMVSPHTVIEFGLMRHQELQTENNRFRRSSQVMPDRQRPPQPLVTARASMVARLSSLRGRLRGITDAEKLLDTFARMDQVPFL